MNVYILDVVGKLNFHLFSWLAAGHFGNFSSAAILFLKNIFFYVINLWFFIIFIHLCALQQPSPQNPIFVFFRFLMPLNMQAERLKVFIKNIWKPSLNTKIKVASLPEVFPGCIISNEALETFSATFLFHGRKIKKRHFVCCNGMECCKAHDLMNARYMQISCSVIDSTV